MKRIIIIISLLMAVSVSASSTETISKLIDKRFNSLSSEDQQSFKGMQALSDSLRLDVKPLLATADQKEAEAIADRFNLLISSADSDTDMIEGKPLEWVILNTMTQYHDFVIKVAPKDFAHRLAHVQAYETFSTKRYVISEDYGPRYPDMIDKKVAELKKKTVELSRQLVRDFPNEPDAYDQLTVVLFEVAKNSEEAEKMAVTCANRFPKFTRCKDLIAFFKEKKTELIWHD